MRYPARLVKDQVARKVAIFNFEDGTEVATQADAGESIEAMAREALELHLEAYLEERELPPKPSTRAPKGKVLWVDVPPRLAFALNVRWARQEAGLSQAELAERLKVSQQQVAKLEAPTTNPKLETIQRVAEVLGKRLEFAFSST